MNSMNINPLLLTDFYKIGHPFQYPPGTTRVYSNFTPRKSRMAGVDRMVHFGLQYFCQEYLMHGFRRNFFDRRRGEVMDEYRRVIRNTIGELPNYDHIEKLWHLRYLPLLIRSLPEGSAVPMRVPTFTVENTHPSFGWLTNRIETVASAVIWQPCTSATIARAYRETLEYWADKTGMPPEFVQWQGHDFSFRGMGSCEAGLTSGMGHLLSFSGTDTIPAIMGAEKYYDADITKELIGASVPATEHSVMCAGGSSDEFETFRRLIMDVYPKGIVSIVSDTWDLWRVLTDFLPRLRTEIMKRDGKVVIRPDSGDPTDILCGNPGAAPGTPARKGVIELLWDVFGGTVNGKGYKMLHPSVGAIYGDSITRERAKAIAARLAAKGFANQEVLGIGSYTYQCNTRDTFGTAIKATQATVLGVDRDLYKQPVTDDGTKYSAKGRLSVVTKDGDYRLIEGTDEAPGNLLAPVWKDGEFIKRWTFAEVRRTLAAQPMVLDVAERALLIGVI